MMPSELQTNPEPSDCDVYWRSRPPKNPKGSKNGSTSRRRIVDSVWMFTTDGSTSCATTTTGVRRDAETVAGICAEPLGPRLTGCDSAIGLQARESAKRVMKMRRFMVSFRFYEG